MSTGSRIIGRFENTRVYLHWKTEKRGRHVDGRYIRVGGVFELGAPPLKASQFVGIHEHLFCTVSYPDYVKDLLGAAADLPSVPELGPITWANPVGLGIHGKDLSFFVPRSVWWWDPGDYEDIIKTTSYFRAVNGIGNGTFHLLEIPLLSREFLRTRYRPKRKPNQKRPRKT